MAFERLFKKKIKIMTLISWASLNKVQCLCAYVCDEDVCMQMSAPEPVGLECRGVCVSPYQGPGCLGVHVYGWECLCVTHTTRGNVGFGMTSMGCVYMCAPSHMKVCV